MQNNPKFKKCAKKSVPILAGSSPTVRGICNQPPVLQHAARDRYCPTGLPEEVGNRDRMQTDRADTGQDHKQEPGHQATCILCVCLCVRHVGRRAQQGRHMVWWKGLHFTNLTRITSPSYTTTYGVVEGTLHYCGFHTRFLWLLEGILQNTGLPAHHCCRRVEVAFGGGYISVYC